MTSPREPDDFVANPLVLRCVEVVELVTHYLDGALDERDHAGFETHLAGCTGCTVFVAQIRRTVELSAAVGNAEPATLPANFTELSTLISRRGDAADTE